MTDSDSRDPAAATGLSIDQIRGASYRGLIDEQLAEERATKNGLEQRGLAVITTSGILATLVFGVAAFATQTQKFTLHEPEQGLLAAALVCFVAAAAAALMAVQPRSYAEAKIEKLKERVSPEEWFRKDVLEAYRRDALLNVRIIEVSRQANGCKARWLTGAIILEVVAVGSVALVVGLVLFGV
jgi:hypothetical protein